MPGSGPDDLEIIINSRAGQDHTGNKCVFIKDLKMNSGYSVYC